MTFQQCADSYIKDHRAGWRNGKHVEQWDERLSHRREPGKVEGASRAIHPRCPALGDLQIEPATVGPGAFALDTLSAVNRPVVRAMSSPQGYP